MRKIEKLAFTDVTTKHGELIGIELWSDCLRLKLGYKASILDEFDARATANALNEYADRLEAEKEK